MARVGTYPSGKCCIMLGLAEAEVTQDKAFKCADVTHGYFVERVGFARLRERKVHSEIADRDKSNWPFSIRACLVSNCFPGDQSSW